MPLQTQNAISRTLYGFITPQQKVRLEDFEVGVFAELNNIILKDDGEPDIEKEKQNIIMEINIKLEELQRLYKERHLVTGTKGNLSALWVL